jgi:hypothetical protein
MIIAVILLGVCQIVAMFGVCLLIRMWAERKQEEIERKLNVVIHSWVDSQGEGQPSKLAVVMEAVGALVGAAAAKSIMASVKQQSSSVAQVANGLSDGIEAQQNPLLAMLGGKRGKGSAVSRLLTLIGPMLGGNHKQDGGTGTPPKFDL